MRLCCLSCNHPLGLGGWGIFFQAPRNELGTSSEQRYSSCHSLQALFSVPQQAKITCTGQGNGSKSEKGTRVAQVSEALSHLGCWAFFRDFVAEMISRERLAQGGMIGGPGRTPQTGAPGKKPNGATFPR